MGKKFSKQKCANYNQECPNKDTKYDANDLNIIDRRNGKFCQECVNNAAAVKRKRDQDEVDRIAAKKARAQRLANAAGLQNTPWMQIKQIEARTAAGQDQGSGSGQQAQDKQLAARRAVEQARKARKRAEQIAANDTKERIDMQRLADTRCTHHIKVQEVFQRRHATTDDEERARHREDERFRAERTREADGCFMDIDRARQTDERNRLDQLAALRREEKMAEFRATFGFAVDDADLKNNPLQGRRRLEEEIISHGDVLTASGSILAVGAIYLLIRFVKRRFATTEEEGIPLWHTAL